MRTKMPLPEKKEALEAAGWVFDNEAKCSGCGAPVEWWITPNGKKMPMRVWALDERGEVIKDGSLIRPFSFVRRSHFADCPNAADFRRKK
jgi:hypothetical protein